MKERFYVSFALMRTSNKSPTRTTFFNLGFRVHLIITWTRDRKPKKSISEEGVVEKYVTFFSTKKVRHFWLKSTSLKKNLGVLLFFYVRSRARNNEVNIIIF